METEIQNQESSRYEKKRAEREERERQERMRARMKKIRNYGIGVLVLAGLVFGVASLIRKAAKTEATKPGEIIVDMGRDHVAQAVPLEKYNSVPPTSGPHFASQTNWGIHKEPLPEGYQIHNLEHGGVLIQYKPDLAADVIEKLKGVGERYGWKKLILAPYPPLDKNIALTAWARLDTFDEFDEARINAFIKAYRNRGPENVPDNMQSVTLP